MDELKLVFPDLPYAVEEAMNRLRINVWQKYQEDHADELSPERGKVYGSCISVENACRGRIPECTC